MSLSGFRMTGMVSLLSLSQTRLHVLIAGSPCDLFQLSLSNLIVNDLTVSRLDHIMTS